MQEYFDDLKWKSSEIVEWVQESLDIYIDEQLLEEENDSNGLLLQKKRSMDEIVENTLIDDYQLSDEQLRKKVLEKIKERLKDIVMKHDKNREKSKDDDEDQESSEDSDDESDPIKCFENAQTEHISWIQETIYQVTQDSKKRVQQISQTLRHQQEKFDFNSDPTFRKLVQSKFGYPLEKHVYSTKDGYLNTVFRIPGKNREDDPKGKPVVIYQHGLVDCCAGIVCQGENSLGLRLVNAGYDLWLNNSRGNRFSRDHQYIDLEQANIEELDDYWDFSFQEMAEYDQISLWEFIEAKTNQKQATYIGHSQGTCQMFAALSDNPEFFKDRMKKFVALAPIVRIENMKSELLKQMSNDEEMIDVLQSMGLELFTSAPANNFLGKLLMKSRTASYASNTLFNQTSDSNTEGLDQQALQLFWKFYPAGCSYRQIDHFMQMLHTGEFKKYDWGKEKNKIIYKSEDAPKYELENIKGHNIKLICGKYDMLSSTPDYLWLNEQLKKFGNDVEILELELGHLGLQLPESEEYRDKIFKMVID